MNDSETFRRLSETVLEIHGAVCRIEGQLEQFATSSHLYEKINEHKRDCATKKNRTTKTILAVIGTIGGVIGGAVAALVSYYR